MPPAAEQLRIVTKLDALFARVSHTRAELDRSKALLVRLRSKIIDAVNRVEGVIEVDRVRIRRAGNRYFADVVVGLARTVTFQHSGRVAELVADSVHNVLPDADVTVNSVPLADRTENIFDQIRAVAN